MLLNFSIQSSSIDCSHSCNNKSYNYDCSLSTLKELKGLDLSGNNFSESLPDVVGSISTLNKLDLWDCQLTGLPERYV